MGRETYPGRDTIRNGTALAELQAAYVANLIDSGFTLPSCACGSAGMGTGRTQARERRRFAAQRNIQQTPTLSNYSERKPTACSNNTFNVMVGDLLLWWL